MPSARGVRAGSAYVEVYQDDSKLRRSLKGLGAQFSSVGGQVSRLGGQVAGLGASIGGLGAVGISALAWPLKLASNIENTEAAFTTLLKDGNAARKLISGLQSDAASTPLQFDELADATKKLLAFGSQAGSVREELRRIGDISSAIGAPIGELAEIYGKARVQGRLFAEDINQLTGRGIPVIQELAKQFGVTDQEVKKLVENGKVNFKNLERAFVDLTTGAGKFAGGMARQSKTLSGSFSTLKDQIIAAFRPFGEVLLPVAKDALSVASRVVTAFGKWARENKKLVLPIAAAVGAMAALGTAAGVVGVAVLGVGSALAGVASIASGLASLLSPPFLIAAGVAAGLAVQVVAIGGGLAYVADQAGLLRPAIAFIGQSFARVFGTVKQSIGGIIAALRGGQFQLAAKIAWAGVKLATLQGAQQVLKGIDYLWANAGRITVSFFSSLASLVYKVFASLPRLAFSALRGGAALTAALQQTLAGAFSGGSLAAGLDPALQRAQANLNRLTSEAAQIPQRGRPVAATVNRGLRQGGNRNVQPQFNGLLNSSKNQEALLRQIAAQGGLLP